MKQHRRIKSLAAALVIWAFLVSGLPVAAQDISPSEDLSLGAGVFVFRSAANKSSQKRLTAAAAPKTRRTKVERVVTAQKIRRQTDNSPKTAVNRPRVKPIAPAEVAAAQIKRQTPTEAAKVMVGAGQYALNAKNYAEAVESFQNAVDLDAKNPDAKIGLSDALTAQGDEAAARDQPRNALNFYNDAVHYNPQNAAAFAGLGASYEALEDTVKAVANYEKALSLDAELTEIYAPLGVLYYQQNATEKAADYLTKAYALDQSDAATDLYYGIIKFENKDYDAAAKSLRESINANKDQAAAHFYLGATNDALNQDAAAITEYNEAIRLNADYAEAYFNLGAIYYGQKNYRDALVNYQKAVKLQNTNGAAHVNLGDVYLALKDYPNAEGEYRLATNFIKDDGELYSKFGYVLGKQYRWNNAITELTKAVQLTPDALDYTNLGWAYYNAAQVDLLSKRDADAAAKLQQAKAAQQKSVEMNDKFAPAFLNLGLTLNDLKEYQAATVALQRAIELRKNWIFAINELGNAYFQLKDYPNAIAQFQKTVDLDGKFTPGLFSLGRAQFISGNVKDAKKTLAKLRPLNTGLADRLEILILGMKMK